MSLNGNEQSGPQLYHYAGNSSLNSYIAPSQPSQPVQVHRVSEVQPVITSHPVNHQSVETTNQPNSQFRGSKHESDSKDKRFTAYENSREYKYNLFSLIDEPWNRCLQVGKCGKCPGNECITRQTRRGLWNWN